MKSFNELDQGDQVMILEVARVALDDKTILEQMSISNKYAEELQNVLDKITSKLTNTLQE